MAELKQLVRIINADVPGEKQVYYALTKVSGVSYPLSSAICNVLNLKKREKVGFLQNEQIKKIEEVIKDPLKFNIPKHLLNRRKDIETGEDKHLTATDLRFSKEFDIKRMKKMRSYKGIRHGLGLPVRGQRTRSNFRKGKAVGVSKKKAEVKKETK